MKFFDGVCRIRVISGILKGKMGTVWRKLIRDESAWVRMDEALPEGLRRFPEGDERANNVILWPEECEACPTYKS